MTEYKVNEMFETIQGEGYFTGVPSVFIRLHGCPVGCSWCDTKHTWDINPDKQIPFRDLLAKTTDDECWSLQSSKQLFAHIQENYSAKHIVITGGEPCLYDLTELTGLLTDNGYSCQIETSGTFEILTNPLTWVTVSPKIAMKGGYEVLKSAIDRADEIKHPVAMHKHIEELDELLAKADTLDNKTICLQPISQKANATQLAIKYCIERNWRLSVQLHKYIGIA